MAQGFQPVPLDQLPIPQAAAPTQFQPAQLSPTPSATSDQPPGAGYMGTTGKIADIGSNFLQGWLKGKQKASEHKLAIAQNNVETAHQSFLNDQEKAAQVMNDPNATQEAKNLADDTRKKSWGAYLDIAQQYTEPEKTKGKGGAKGAMSGMAEHFKKALGTEDPHLFAQAGLALLRSSGPPPIQPPSAQEQEAQRDLANHKKIDNSIDALMKARAEGRPDEEIKKLEQSVRDQRGEISPERTRDQEFKDAVAEQGMNYLQGKPISEKAKKLLEQQGIIPQPILPNVITYDDGKGHFYSQAVDKQTGKPVGPKNLLSTTALPKDQAQEAAAIRRSDLNFIRGELKKAYQHQPPQQGDLSDGQIEQVLSQAALDKYGFKPIKTANGNGPDGKPMTPERTNKAISDATTKVLDKMSPQDREQTYSFLRNTKLDKNNKPIGQWIMLPDLMQRGAPTGDQAGALGYKAFLWHINPWADNSYFGTDKAGAQDALVNFKDALGKQLKQEGYTDEQVGEMVQREGGSKSASQLSGPPKNYTVTIGGQEYTKPMTPEDVEDFKSQYGNQIQPAE